MSYPSTSDISQSIAIQQVHFKANPNPDYKSRLTALKTLRALVQKNEDAFCEALYSDFKKPHFETFTTEISVLLAEINQAIDHLKNWMQPQSVATNVANLPASSFIQPHPYGVCLIIGAWNYPVLLTLNPLVSALAAGNNCILKPSELTPKTAQLIENVIHKSFPAEQVRVIQGGVAETTHILTHQFDKIFFTGSTGVGKIVYQAAAKHLTPVTLELGGKCPAVVFADAQLNVAAQRMVWSKFINAGQTCVSPDYILVHASVKEKLVEKLIYHIEKMFGTNSENSENYARLISAKQFEHVNGMIDSEKVVYGGHTNANELFISPTLMHNVSVTDTVMQDEIFGPVLPILTFETIDQALEIINHNPSPLALYTFSKSNKNHQSIQNNVVSGNAVMNDCVVHLANHHLPFGGVGNSGMGSYHGKFGFDTFSHQKGVLNRMDWFELPVKYPPYNSTKKGIIKKML